MRVLASGLVILFAASIADADDKFELKSKEGRFSVTFPAKVKESVQEVPLQGTDKKITVTQYVLEVGKSSAYIVAYNDYPDGVLAKNPQDALTNVRNGSIGAEGTLEDEQKGTFGENKLPMREVTFSKGNLKFRNKLILDGNRLYQVLVVADNEKALTSNSAKAFFDSFSLAKKK